MVNYGCIFHTSTKYKRNRRKRHTHTYNKTNLKHQNVAAWFYYIRHWSALAQKKDRSPNLKINYSEKKWGSQTSSVHFWRGASWSVRISKVKLACGCRDSFESSCGMMEARVQERSQIRPGTTEAWTSCLTDWLWIRREKCDVLLGNLSLHHFLHLDIKGWKKKIKVGGNENHFNIREHLTITGMHKHTH